jgi:hypothetical protein
MRALMRLAWFWSRAGSLCASALALMALRACFIEIQAPQDPVRDDGSAGSSGVGASGGSSGVGGSAGSAGGTSGTNGTGGTGVCDGGCGTQCTSCGDGGNAERTCSGAGTCIIVKCDPNFVDCDGDVANGCEAQFGPFADELGLGETTADGGQTWIIPHLANRPSVDMNSDMDPTGVTLTGWNEAQSIRLDFACGATCKSDTAPGDLAGSVPIENFGVVPADGDLKAYFRVGWNTDSIFVLALVQDDELVGDSSGAQRQDSLELFWDKLSPSSENYVEDDYHVFIGAVDGTMQDPQQPGQASPSKIGVTRHILGSCYFIQAEFKSGSIVPLPTSGEEYGFSVGVNDWDSTRGTPGRENQVLWHSPGAQYGHRVVQFPRVQLQ